MNQNNIDISQLLCEQVTSFVKAHHLAGKMLAGFSGGVDSTALLLALHHAGCDVTAVHFNHGIRGQEADADEQWCKTFCSQRQIPFISKNLAVPQNMLDGEGEEAAGRRLRLAAWLELSNNGKIPVFLAHHADDSLEDLFLRMARGANSSGLTGLRKYRKIGNLTLCRPLLDLQKSQLEMYVRSHWIHDWCLDRTNNENTYRRNAVRNRLLPEWRQCFGNDLGLRQSLSVLRQDADCLEQLAEAKFTEIANADFALSSWANIHDAILQRVLRNWFEQAHCPLLPSHAIVERLSTSLASVQKNSHFTIPLDNSWSLIASEGKLKLSAELPPPEPESFQWNWQRTSVLEYACGLLRVCTTTDSTQNASCEAFDADVLSPVITVRPWQAGDTMQPFGSSYRKKLQDIFTDAHIPREKRKFIPILEINGQIIWIAGVRRAEFGRVTDKSRQIVFEWRKSDE